MIEKNLGDKRSRNDRSAPASPQKSSGQKRRKLNDTGDSKILDSRLGKLSLKNKKELSEIGGVFTARKADVEMDDAQLE